MKISPFTTKFKFWILKVLQLQLFITIVSLPILISWGLPISLASPAGNIIFTPVLSLFLFLSSIIFFFEILYIPNEILIKLLEFITTWWTKCLSIGTDKWLIGFPITSSILLVSIPIIALLILQNKHTNNLITSCMLFCAILTTFGLYSKLSIDLKDKVELIKLDNKIVTIKVKNKKISIIDYENLLKTSTSFIEYTFMPQLIKKFGNYNLENIIVFEPGKKNIKSINFLLKKVKINKIYFILNKKTLTLEKAISEINNPQKTIIEIKYLNDPQTEEFIKETVI